MEFDIVTSPLRKNNCPHFDSTFICFGAAFIHVEIGVFWMLIMCLYLLALEILWHAYYLFICRGPFRTLGEKNIGHTGPAVRPPWVISFFLLDLVLCPERLSLYNDSQPIEMIATLSSFIAWLKKAHTQNLMILRCSGAR